MLHQIYIKEVSKINNSSDVDEKSIISFKEEIKMSLTLNSWRIPSSNDELSLKNADSNRVYT